MARYIEDAGINQPIDVVSMVMEDYVYHHRYTRTDWNGEPVYCCRDSFGKDRYLVWSYASGILHLEAWLKGAFGKEANLSGIGSGRSGKEYQKSLEQLLKKLREHSGDTSNVGYIGEDPFMHKQAEAARPAQPAPQQPKPAQPAYQQPKPAQPAYQQPKPVQPAYQQPKPAQPAYQQPKPAQPAYQQPNPTQPAYQQPRPQGTPYNPQGTSYGTQGRPNGMPGIPSGIPGNPYGAPYGMPENSTATVAMVLGIIGVCTAMCVPFLGLILGIIGKNQSRMTDTSAGRGKAANILCTIAIVLSIIGFLTPILWMFIEF